MWPTALFPDSKHSFSPRCKKCKGAKTVKEKNKHEIHIEKGMADKQRIVLAGAGDQEVTWVLIVKFAFDEFILFSLAFPLVMWCLSSNSALTNPSSVPAMTCSRTSQLRYQKHSWVSRGY